MRYSADEFEILLFHMVRSYDLEWDSPSFELDIREAAYTELKKREGLEEYEQCALIRDFSKWLDQRLA
jgi:hypothetical protein